MIRYDRVVYTSKCIQIYCNDSGKLLTESALFNIIDGVMKPEIRFTYNGSNLKELSSRLEFIKSKFDIITSLVSDKLNDPNIDDHLMNLYNHLDIIYLTDSNGLINKKVIITHDGNVNKFKYIE